MCSRRLTSVCIVGPMLRLSIVACVDVSPEVHERAGERMAGARPPTIGAIHTPRGTAIVTAVVVTATAAGRSDGPAIGDLGVRTNVARSRDAVAGLNRLRRGTPPYADFSETDDAMDGLRHLDRWSWLGLDFSHSPERQGDFRQLNRHDPGRSLIRCGFCASCPARRAAHLHLIARFALTG